MTDPLIDTCAQCKGRIKEVDLYGHEFFRHKPRQDCLTWHHEDERHNWTHQAVPDRCRSSTEGEQ